MKYDAIIIGAGHNGLVCAFYLARAGMRVRIVERRDIVGGAAVTEEFHPGFENSVASYTVSLLQPKVIADMENLRASASTTPMCSPHIMMRSKASPKCCAIWRSKYRPTSAMAGAP